MAPKTGIDQVVIVPDENAFDLDAVMQEGMTKFEGQLAEAAGISPDTSQISVPDPGTGEDEETVGKKTGDPSEEGGTEKKIKTDESPGAGDAGLRFKSHEEAEKGYKELQGKTTRIETELTELKGKQIERNVAEAAEAEKKKFGDDIFGFSKKANREALDAIDVLDPDDFEDNGAYQDAVSDIWAKKDMAIAGFTRASTAAASPQTTVKAATTPPAEKPTGDESEDAWDRVQKMAEDAGIDPKDEFFIRTCAVAPREDGTGNKLAFDDQVGWAIEETKTYQAKFTGPAAANNALNHQKRGMPMGRATITSPLAKEPEGGGKVTLNDAVEDALESRRL